MNKLYIKLLLSDYESVTTEVHFKALIRLELPTFQVVSNPDLLKGSLGTRLGFRGEVRLSGMCMFIKYRLI